MKKYDEIRIEGLTFKANHGVFDFETEQGQMFGVNAVLYTDTNKYGASDNLQDATDYGKVCQFIYEFLTEHTYQLLEAACEHVVRELLLAFPLVQGIKFELMKPEAPIPHHFDAVSVCIERFRHTAYIAFGSNMGDKKKYIEDGLAELVMNPCIELVSKSSIIITKPYGEVEQSDFLNGVCKIETLLSPEELLSELHRVEEQAHRTREVHWGPRTLDLDIIYYDDLVMNTDELIIPHVDMENRTFVLEPLCEIAPNFRHPLNHKTSVQMLKALKKEV